MTNLDIKFMLKAIEKAKEGINNGQTPFGAVILDKTGQIIACAHNTVWKTTDITAHAEINAIREACKNVNDIHLNDSTIYSTCEPCPMCFAAIHWARISRIVYGATIQDAKAFGFNELEISDAQLAELCKSKIELVPKFMEQECIGLFKEWAQSPKKRTY